MAFLLTFPYTNLPAVVPSLFGYIMVVVLFILSHVWRKTFQHISRYILAGACLLLYFSTLRLHFFSDFQTVANLDFELSFLFLVVLVIISIALYKKSVFLTGMGLTVGYITNLISGADYLIFFFISMFAIISAYLKIKYDWNKLFIYTIILSYLTHFIWFINNPLIGNSLQFVDAPQTNLAFVIIYMMIFALGNLLRNKEITEHTGIISASFLNCAGFIGISFLILVSKFQSLIFLISLISSVIFLIFSALFWIREKSRVSTFFYAISGYTILSIAIVSKFENPDFFIFLIWQSIIVISTAIWYRSKFIIVANFVIYLMIFISYLIMVQDITIASLSFGIVALLSARIMNWQKENLDLKTEIMRNAYLACAFVMIPYTLYHTVAGQYIIISWMGVSIGYYILSRILSNNKYRWMALLTLFMTVIYILIIGIVRLDPVYRILSFLILGIVLISISLTYSRIKLRKSGSGNNKNMDAGKNKISELSN
jgi:hypothetical protein